MIKKLVFILPIFLGLAGCNKNFVENETEQKYNEDVATIKAYAAANNITLRDDTGVSGLLYSKSVELPDARVPDGSYQMHIAYSIKVLDGSIITSKTVADSAIYFFYNSPVFDGFISAIFSLREGEKATFYIPSPLAYGKNPPNGVPAWAILQLDLEAVKYYSEEDRINLYISKKKLTVGKQTDSGVRVIYGQTRPETADLVAGDNIKVKYSGKLLNDAVFDSGTLDISLGGTGFIPGFDTGLRQMRVGEKGTIIFPSSQGYGANGSSSGNILPYTPLVFEVEVVSKN